MFNLLKNVFRSLSKNKTSVIGLTFLVFLSVGLFTVLKSTTINIDTTYQKVSIEGNQHDFTISEMYNTGNISFVPGSHDANQGVGKSSDGASVPWPDQTGSGSEWTKTYYYKLDAGGEGKDSLVDQFYETYCDQPDTPEYKLIYRQIVITNANHLTYMDGNHVSSKTNVEISQQLSSDTPEITSQLSKFTNELLNYITVENSPMVNYLDTELKDQVYYRHFSSLKVDDSPDNIYYDIVQTQPVDDNHPYENLVDREMVFNNSEFGNIGWTNFSASEWKPSDNLTVAPYDALAYNLEDWNIVASDISKQNIIKEKFEILTKGSIGNVPEDSTAGKMMKLAKQINEKLQSSPFDSIQSDYNSFKSDYVLHDINNKSYTYVLTFEHNSVPFTWDITNWTSYFAMCAPQYMQKHNLKPFDIVKMLQSDKDYQEWIKDHSDIQTDRARFIAWMNSLSKDELSQKFTQWQQDYPNNLVDVACGTPFMILAAGITGDYVYPIVSVEKPIPNTNKECIVFTNDIGYQRVFQAFQRNKSEQYIVGKFINPKDGSSILDEINSKAKEIMSWPENIKAAYMANDTSCTLNASAFRISYIPQLVDKIDLICYMLTLFVLGLGLLISGIIVRRYVDHNRTNIGVMRANGIKKWAIALSLTPFALLPSLLGGICGYLVGTFLQAAAIGLFSAYWTLPTTLISFNWLSMVLAVILPFLVFVLVSICSTYVVLREKTTELMKQGSEIHVNWLAKNIKKPLKRIGIVARFRCSIAFTSIWKLFVLTIVTSLAMSTLVFSFCINGKLDLAVTKTMDTRNYKYAIDLYTPTVQGGQYIPVSQEYYGLSGFQESARNVGYNFIPSNYADKSDNYSKAAWENITSSNDQTKLFTKSYYDTTFTAMRLFSWFTDYLKNFEDDGKDYQNFFVPFLSDSVGQKTDLQYLKNRFSTESTMDYLVGVSLLNMTSNPWLVASSLMPDNLKNICVNKYNSIINDVGAKTYGSDPEWTQYKTYFNQILQPDDTYKYEINQNNAVHWSGCALDANFLKLLIKIYMDNDIKSTKDDYLLDYNMIPLNSEEETYTYLTASNNDIPSAKIVGITNGTDYVSLFDSSKKDLQPLINYETFDSSSKEYPLIVNAVAAKKHHLRVGQIINFTITNTADRFVKQVNDDDTTTTATFKIVGISQSFEGEEYYTDQQIANYILGLKTKFNPTYGSNYQLNNYYIRYHKVNGKNGAITATFTVDDGKDANADYNNIDDLTSSHETYNVVPYGFNGYFTNDENGSKGLTNGYFFYSPSGLWGASESISSNSSRQVLSYGWNIELASIFSGMYDPETKTGTDLGIKIHEAYTTRDRSHIDDYVNEFIQKFSKVFGDTQYVTLVTGADSKEANEMVYRTMSSTIQQIEIVVLVIVAMIVFFIVLLMSTLIISDSKKLAAILKSLGFSDKQNALSFMSIYIPVILLGLLISIPIAIGVVKIFQLAVLNGVGLLVDSTIRWYFYLVAAGVISIEFAVSCVFSVIALKKDKLIDLIK